MDPGLREFWMRIADADDLDEHMACVGQAQANAVLVRDLLAADEGPAPRRILFAGAGTGQMLDYLDPGFLRPHRVTFTDINPALLSKLARRLEASGLDCSLVIDDIEAPALAPGFDAIVAVLVLEHVDWRKAVGCMARLAPRRIHVVSQRNPPSLETAISLTRPLNRTMAAFARMARPALLDEKELVAEMGAHGFSLDALRERAVADGKTMVGMSFEVKSC